MPKLSFSQFTTLELATKLQVSKESAYGLITFLKEKGIAVECGKTSKPPGQRGKGQTVYCVDHWEEVTNIVSTVLSIEQ